MFTPGGHSGLEGHSKCPSTSSTDKVQPGFHLRWDYNPTVYEECKDDGVRTDEGRPGKRR